MTEAVIGTALSPIGVSRRLRKRNDRKCIGHLDRCEFAGKPKSRGGGGRTRFRRRSHPGRTLKPNLYVGAGVGLAHGKGSFTTPADLFQVDDSSLAWQWIAGANYPINTQVDLYAEYRFLQAKNFAVCNQITNQILGDFEADSHDVVIGLRFRR